MSGPPSTISAEKLSAIRSAWQSGDSAEDIAKRFDVSIGNILNVWCRDIQSSHKKRIDIRRRAVFILHIEGNSIREISEIMGISAQSVRALLHRHGWSKMEEMPDDPRWYFARALLGRAKSEDEMAEIWEEYQDIWTLELTRYGRSVLASIPVDRAHERVRLHHDWEVAR